MANLFGQNALSVEKQIPTVKGKTVKYRKVILPNSLLEKFTKLLVAKSEKNYKFANARIKTLFQKISFFSVEEYFKSGVEKNKDGTFSASMQSHPARYPAILYKSKLYVFSESNAETDAEIFNIFLKKTNLKIENEAEALELTNLYFSVTRGYFENKGKLILSKVEDVPLSYRQRKEEETKRLKEIIVLPTSKTVDEGYEVELFTWEMALGEVKKWSFKIQPNAQIEVQSEIIGKL